MTVRGRDGGRGGGQLPTDLAALFREIHAVNPTDRGLRPAEQQARYARKAALQSRLIALHGEVLDVQPDPRDEDVVSLHHRSGERDAAHARISTLDEAARAWVRARLTEAARSAGLPAAPGGLRGAPPVMAAAPAAPASSDLLAAGREALEAYDYDQARACFERAVEAGSGASAPLLALVELLVDHLALDAEALGLPQVQGRSETLPSELRGLLAEAAARTGEVARATAWLDGLRGPRAGAAWALLVRGALDAGDLDAARQALDHLHEVDPANAERLRLGERLSARVAEGYGPREDALHALLAAGDWEQALAQAQALLRDWPGSEVARQVRAESARRQQQAQQQDLREQAQAAEDRQDLEEAVRLWRAAVAAGAEELSGPLSRAEAALARRQAQAAVREVRAVLDAGQRRAARLATLALTPAAVEVLRADREALRADPALGWLLELGPVGARRPLDAVAAVEAIETAAELLADGRPERALELLDPSPLVSQVPAGRELSRRCREALAARERDRALEALAAGALALEAGEAEEAVGHLDLCAVAHLTAAELARWEELAHRARPIAERARREAALRAFEQAGDWLAARALALRYAEETGDPTWVERAARADARLHEAWEFEVLPGEAAWPDLRDFRLSRVPCEPSPWLTPDGQELILSDGRGPLLTIWRLKVDGMRLVEVVCLRAPASMEGCRGQVDGDRLWLLAADGVVELSRAPWSIRSWTPTPPPPGPSVAHQGSTFVAAGRYLWSGGGLSPDGSALLSRIVDLSTGRIERVLPACAALGPVGFGEGSAAFRRSAQGQIEVLGPRGGREMPWRFSVPLKTVLAPLFDLRSLLAVMPDQLQGEEAGGLTAERARGDLRCILVRADHVTAGKPPAITLPGVRWHGPGVDVAVSSLCHLAFLKARSKGGADAVVALARTESLLKERWRADAPRNSTLVQDPEGRHAAILGLSHRGAWARALGPDPLVVDMDRVGQSADFVTFDPPFALLATESVRRIVHQVAEKVGWPQADSRESWARSSIPGLDARGAFGALAMLTMDGHEDLAGEMLAEHRQAWPGDPWLELLELHLGTNARRWAEVVALGEAIRVDELPVDCQVFVSLMRSVAHIWLSNLEDAARIARASPAGELVDQRNLIDSIEELQGAPGGEERRARAPDWIPFLRALCDHEARVQAGRHAEALDALDNPYAFLMSERQSLARLASLRLDLPADTPAARYRRRATLLALLSHLRAASGKVGHNLPLGPWTWGPERIEAVAARARQALGLDDGA